MSTEPHPGARADTLKRLTQLGRRYKSLLQATVLGLIALFLGAGVWRSWAQLRGYSWHVQWWLLLAAFALFVTQELSFALIWRSIVRRLGSELAIVASERIYLSAEFVRYIPGNVWHVITRVLMAERRGVPKAVGFASMVIELATKIASAALVFAVTLLAWPDAHALTAHISSGALVVGGVVGAPLLLLGLHPRLLGFVLDRGLRLVGREPVRITLTYGDILLITGYWAASWVLVGAGFYLLVLAMVPAPLSATALLLALGIYALAWDVGFLSFVTPSGLGVRELVLWTLLVLAGLVPVAGLAVVVAVVTRLFTTGAELICVSGAYLARGRSTPLDPVRDTSGANEPMPAQGG